MNPNSLLILIILCSSADALTKTWTDTSPDGNTTCNHTFTYEKVEKFEVNETIGDPFFCTSTEPCIRMINYERTFRDPISNKESENEELDEDTIGNIIGKVSKVGNNEIVTQNIRHISDSIHCSLKPGYKGQIIAKIRYHKIMGNYEQRCLTLCDDCVVNVLRYPIDVEVPINENELSAGKIDCDVSPAANYDTMKKLCNTDGDRVYGGPRFEAINKAIRLAVVNAPLKESKSIEKWTVDGVNVWSLAMCFNGLEEQACQACLSYLATRILGECGNTAGAQVYVNDCGLRYERYEITPFNFDDSFPTMNPND